MKKIKKKKSQCQSYEDYGSLDWPYEVLKMKIAMNQKIWVTGTGKKMYSALESPEGKQPCQLFNTGRPISDFWSLNQ